MHLLDLKYALILVENKDNQDILTWCVEYQENLVEEQCNRLSTWHRAIRDIPQGLPARICASPQDPRAKRCNACKRCFDVEVSLPAQEEIQLSTIEGSAA